MGTPAQVSSPDEFSIVLRARGLIAPIFTRALNDVTLLLIMSDLLFLALHGVHTYTAFLRDVNFSVEQERGLPEVTQYVKEYWTALLLMGLFVRERQLLFFAWAVVYGYLLLDDLFSVHELAGGVLVDRFGFQSAGSMRAQDLGELSFAALVGGVLLLLVAATYCRTAREHRPFAHGLGLLSMLLVFFGVGVDTMHSMVQNQVWRDLLAVIEDGGEMLAMSLTCGFVYGRYAPGQSRAGRRHLR